jgi:hypothetical protein
MMNIISVVCQPPSDGEGGEGVMLMQPFTERIASALESTLRPLPDL